MSQSDHSLAQQYQHNLVYLLLNVSRRLRGRLRERMAQLAGGETIPLELFSQIDFTGTRIVDLARRLNCSKQAASKLVQEAERKGWLSLRPDPADGRAKKVFFADEGLALLGRGQVLYGELEAELAAELGEGELGVLIDQLRALQGALRARPAGESIDAG